MTKPKTTCRPVRIAKKPGPKSVRVKTYTRSKPKPIGRRCR